jgi:hypothetical protein
MEKRLFIFPALALFLLFSCAGKTNALEKLETPVVAIGQETFIYPKTFTAREDPAITTMTLSEDTYDFGKMKIGEKYTHKFILTNTGKEMLQIPSVKATCACHGLGWTRTGIAPGETGFVMITYEPKRTGKITKTLTMETNTDLRLKVLKFTGEVVN